MSQKRRERKGLLIGIFINLIMGAAGVWVYELTKIQALFVDAYFTIIALVSGVAAIIISRVSPRKTKHFPQGLFFLEPLYALLKSLLSIVLLGSSVISVTRKAIVYFTQGIGEAMPVGPVVIYEIIMVVLCLLLSFCYYRQNKKIGGSSTMLEAEAKGTMVDGIMSLGIGVAAVVVYFIDDSSPFSFLRYTGDFFITTILVLLSLKTTLMVVIKSFTELSNGKVVDRSLQESISQLVTKHLSPDVMLQNVKIYKVGMFFKVDALIHTRTDTADFSSLMSQKEAIKIDLSKKYEFRDIDFILS